MRIRKRQVPFPLSSLSPVPLSDPLLNLNLNHPSSPVAVVQLHHCDSSLTKPENPLGLPHVHPQPTDRPNHQHPSPTGSAINGSDIPDAGGPHKEEEEKKKKKKKRKQDRSELLQEEDDDDDDERGRGAEEKSNDIRKGSFLGAEPVTGFLQESSSSPRVGRWCEGEKVFPLKKRRGSFATNAETMTSSSSITTAADHNNQKDKKMKAKMKTKMNKKCARKNDDVEEQEDHKESNKEGLDLNNNNNNNAGNAKKRGRGGGLMEGSRCSRVNGRGWRCCQQTLVGYSLCEHHLGKGRLRSMTSVRSRSLAGTAPSEYPKPPPLSSTVSSSLQEKDAKPVMVGDEGKAQDHHENENENEEEEEEKKPLMITKKRMKLGMVKARSISSLLGQSNSSSSSSAISLVDNINGKS